MTAQIEEPPQGRARRPGRRWWIVAGVALLAGVTALAIASGGPADDAPIPVAGRPVLEFDLPALAGDGRVRSAALQGTPSVVNFWASWCAPCRREMPALVAASEQFAGEVQFVGVNHQDNREDAVDFAADAGVAYPSGFDPDGTVARQVGLRGMPTTLFVDADGTILERRTGELSQATLTRTIERLFGKRASG